MAKKRDTSRDGFRNKAEFYGLTRLEPFWKWVQSSDGRKKMANKLLINNAILKIPTRPYAFSTQSPYTSWDSLIDRKYWGLHLPPLDWEPITDDKHLGISLSPAGEFEKRQPPLDDLKTLFQMGEETRYSPKSNLIFPFFVQWFADGFLRSDRTQRTEADEDATGVQKRIGLKNTSNHHIDLCSVYGLNTDITKQLRAYEGGRLKSQTIKNEEYPPFYYDESGDPKPEFSALPHLDSFGEEPARHTVGSKDKLFAMGVEVERANVAAGYVMLNVLCLREHNRVAGVLAAAYPGWDDERIFQTARNIVIVEVMKVVIDEYINHITPYHFQFFTDPLAFGNEKWYRLNWMTVEFSLVYRWHSMLPATFLHDGRRIAMERSMWNNGMIIDHGLGQIFHESSTQPAASLGLHNTPDFLVPVELASVRMGRTARLRSYNDYRELFKYPRATSFEQLTSDPKIAEDLKDLYGKVDNLELYVGLYAEDLRPRSALPSMVGRLVGIDAFSQALTNPLLAQNVFNEETFSPAGWEQIMELGSLSDLVHRNVAEGRKFTVAFDRAEWKR